MKVEVSIMLLYVVLRDLNDESFNNGNLSTLKDFLVSNCTDEREFDDCFKRTRRIVSKIYRINLRKMSEEKVKKYSKTID